MSAPEPGDFEVNDAWLYWLFRRTMLEAHRRVQNAEPVYHCKNANCNFQIQ